MVNFKLFLGAMVFVVSSGLYADEGDMSQKFMAMDTDGDGVVSILEATGQLELLRDWVKVDKNLDGKLENTEFKVYEQAPYFVPPDDPDGGEIGAAPH